MACREFQSGRGEKWHGQWEITRSFGVSIQTQQNEKPRGAEYGSHNLAIGGKEGKVQLPKASRDMPCTDTNLIA
eukprot:711001-Pelagomonas_calceolata.AAC.6